MDQHSRLKHIDRSFARPLGERIPLDTGIFGSIGRRLSRPLMPRVGDKAHIAMAKCKFSQGAEAVLYYLFRTRALEEGAWPQLTTVN